MYIPIIVTLMIVEVNIQKENAKALRKVKLSSF